MAKSVCDNISIEMRKSEQSMKKCLYGNDHFFFSEW